MAIQAHKKKTIQLLIFSEHLAKVSSRDQQSKKQIVNTKCSSFLRMVRNNNNNSRLSSGERLFVRNAVEINERHGIKHMPMTALKFGNWRLPSFAWCIMETSQLCPREIIHMTITPLNKRMVKGQLLIVTSTEEEFSTWIWNREIFDNDIILEFAQKSM